MVRVALHDFVERRVPDHPEWVTKNRSDPQTAVAVYGMLTLGMLDDEERSGREQRKENFDFE
jgi:hypothetical protein